MHHQWQYFRSVFAGIVIVKGLYFNSSHLNHTAIKQQGAKQGIESH